MALPEVNTLPLPINGDLNKIVPTLVGQYNQAAKQVPVQQQQLNAANQQVQQDFQKQGDSAQKQLADYQQMKATQGQELASQQAEVDKAAANIPGQYTPSKPSKEEMESTFQTLLMVSLLLGATTKQPLQNAMGNLTGAMNGYMKGDAQRTATELKDFQENVKLAKDKYQTSIDKYKNIIERHKGDIQGLITEGELQAKADGNQLAADKFKAGDIKGALDLTLGQQDKLMGQIIKLEEFGANKRAQAQAHMDAMELRKATLGQKSQKELQPMFSSVRSIEMLQDRLKDPEVQTGLKAKAAPFIQKLSSLAPDADASAAFDTLNSNDKTTLFIKDAMLEMYNLIRSAKGPGQRVTVNDMKVEMPILDTTSMKPEVFMNLLEQRRQKLFYDLQDKGMSPEEIKQHTKQYDYTPYGAINEKSGGDEEMAKIHAEAQDAIKRNP